VQEYDATRVVTAATQLQATGDAATHRSEWDPGMTLFLDGAGVLRRTRDMTNFEDEVAIAIRRTIGTN